RLVRHGYEPIGRRHLSARHGGIPSTRSSGPDTSEWLDPSRWSSAELRHEQSDPLYPSWLQRYGCLTGRRTRDDSFRMYCERSGNVAKEHLQQRAVGEDQLFGRHASGQTIRAYWKWIVYTEYCLEPDDRKSTSLNSRH